MYLIISTILTGLSLYCLVWTLSKPIATSRLQPGLKMSLLARLAWPWVYALKPFCEPFISWQLRNKLTLLLNLAGVSGLYTPSHIVAMQVVSLCVTSTILTLSFYFIFEFELINAIFTALFLGLFAAYLPIAHFKSIAKSRQQQMLRELPFLLDMTTLCVEAGLNLHGALQQAAIHGPEGPMRFELRHALADMRTGVPKLQALQTMANRTNLPAVINMVASITQADLMGSNLGPLLRAQSEQRRSERFLKAEEQAMKAPVKMLFPMVLCIFPCTFLIIGFPIVMQLLNQN